VPERSDAGVSLVEVMVAMGVFLIGSLALLGVLNTSLAGTFDNRARVTAAHVAASDIDQARSLDYYSLTSTTYPRNVDGRTYTVVRDVAATMSSGATSSCVGSGSARQLYKRVTTTVTTPVRGRMKPVQADTVVKAPVYDASSPTGAIGLVVIDRGGNPLSGLAATAGGANRTTDAKGCAFFDGLAAGTHTATVTRTGSVTVGGRTELSRSVSVAPGQITSSVLRIDTSVPITLRSNVFNGTTAVSGYEAPIGLAGTLSAPDRATATRVEYPAASLALGTDKVVNAFPSPGGYDAHLGPCSPVAHVDSEPGTSPRAELPLSPVKLKLTGSDSNGRDRTATFTWRSTPTCGQQTTYTSKTSLNCSSTTSSDSSACLLYLGVPAGTWRLTISGITWKSWNVTVAPRTAYSWELDVS
jgi:type II secretory pathway pseudopilin PulG